ncbi:unnamed protein product [Linum trigynum]|uniref:SHSP domain-containing protein n=1 Tax=Linum trigynum TaxID=586398 RepID=A0AAV2GLP3_9ROSI
MVEDLSSSQLSTRDELVYEDFMPYVMTLDLRDRLVVFFELSEFEKEHIDVQVIGSDILAIMGQRPMADGHRWIRFKKQIRFQANHDIIRYRTGFGKSDFIIRIPKISASMDHNHDEDATVEQLPAGDAAAAEEQQPVVQVDSDNNGKRQTDHPSVEVVLATEPPATEEISNVANEQQQLLSNTGAEILKTAIHSVGTK